MPPFIPARYRYRPMRPAARVFVPSRYRGSLGDEITDALDTSAPSFNVAETPPPAEVAYPTAAAMFGASDSGGQTGELSPAQYFGGPAPASSGGITGFLTGVSSAVGSILSGGVSALTSLSKIAGAATNPATPGALGVRPVVKSAAPAAPSKGLLSGMTPVYIVGGVAVLALAYEMMKPAGRRA